MGFILLYLHLGNYNYGIELMCGGGGGIHQFLKGGCALGLSIIGVGLLVLVSWMCLVPFLSFPPSASRMMHPLLLSPPRTDCRFFQTFSPGISTIDARLQR